MSASRLKPASNTIVVAAALFGVALVAASVVVNAQATDPAEFAVMDSTISQYAGPSDDTGYDPEAEYQLLLEQDEEAQSLLAQKSQGIDPDDVESSWSKKSTGEIWTAATLKALDEVGTNLINKKLPDAKQFCKNYDKLDKNGRKEFWVAMFASIAVDESALDPSNKYRENFLDSNGKRVVSRGLLQISYESANDYGCGIKAPNDLHDPAQNLRCGVKIFDHWVERDGTVADYWDKHWRGGARYWAVLRKPKLKAAVKARIQKIDLCK
jgi:hypothetical protein